MNGKPVIIDHTHEKYLKQCRSKITRFNGAYLYSKEIVKYIIPNVETKRNWITLNIPGVAVDHAIVFIHNNLYPDHYNWLKKYDDLILVCGVPETVEKIAHLGKAIYLPLSVKVSNIEKYRREKTKETAFVGRKKKISYKGVELPDDIDFIHGLPPTRFLKQMAKYKNVYAVGRCAIEAKILDCNVLPYDPRYPDVDKWKILDSADAAKILNEKLKEIDKER